METEQNISPKKKLKFKKNASADAFFSFLFNLFFYYLVINHYKDVEFLNNDFSEILTLIKFSLLLSAGLSFIRIIFTSQNFKSVVQIVTNVIFLYISVITYKTFPFDTSVIGDVSTWDNIFKALIIIGFIGTLFGCFAEIAKLAKIYPKKAESK